MEHLIQLSAKSDICLLTVMVLLMITLAKLQLDDYRNRQLERTPHMLTNQIQLRTQKVIVISLLLLLLGGFTILKRDLFTQTAHPPEQIQAKQKTYFNPKLSLDQNLNLLKTKTISSDQIPVHITKQVVSQGMVYHPEKQRWIRYVKVQGSKYYFVVTEKQQHQKQLTITLNTQTKVFMNVVSTKITQDNAKRTAKLSSSFLRSWDAQGAVAID